MYFLSLLLIAAYYGIILAGVYMLVRRIGKGPATRIGKFLLLGTTLIIVMLPTNIFYSSLYGGDPPASWREFDKAVVHFSFFFCLPVFLMTLPFWFWLTGRAVVNVVRSMASSKREHQQAIKKIPW